MKSLYDILGIPKNSTKEAIKSAYRKKAQKLHPDPLETKKSFKTFNAPTMFFQMIHGEFSTTLTGIPKIHPIQWNILEWRSLIHCCL